MRPPNVPETCPACGHGPLEEHAALCLGKRWGGLVVHCNACGAAYWCRTAGWIEKINWDTFVAQSACQFVAGNKED